MLCFHVWYVCFFYICKHFEWLLRLFSPSSLHALRPRIHLPLGIGWRDLRQKTLCEVRETGARWRSKTKHQSILYNAKLSIRKPKPNGGNFKYSILWLPDVSFAFLHPLCVYLRVSPPLMCFQRAMVQLAYRIVSFLFFFFFFSDTRVNIRLRESSHLLCWPLCELCGMPTHKYTAYSYTA